MGIRFNGEMRRRETPAAFVAGDAASYATCSCLANCDWRGTQDEECWGKVSPNYVRGVPNWIHACQGHENKHLEKVD
jgi:hypothetical protein